ATVVEDLTERRMRRGECTCIVPFGVGVRLTLRSRQSTGLRQSTELVPGPSKEAVELGVSCEELTGNARFRVCARDVGGGFHPGHTCCDRLGLLRLSYARL